MTASEARIRTVPWRALRGLGAALEPALARVLAGDPAERVVDRFLRDHRRLGSPQRAAAAEAIFGVALWRRRLAWHLAVPPSAGAPPLALLASLARDLGGLAADEAEAVAGLGPGALPPAAPAPAEPAVRFSFPDWLWQSLVAEVGAEAEALADALDLPGPVCLRPNLLRTTPAALAARLAEEGVATRPGRLVPSALVVTSPRPNVYGLAAHRGGLLEVQDEASQLVGELLGARPGESVLDLCAGAGGKSLQLAAAVGAEGRVHAADVDAGRLRRLRARAERAGAGAIILVCGAAPPPDLRVDAALVDAPCSELGALRRGPDARFRVEPASFERMPALQLALLGRAAAHVRPGGRLAYATCTFRRDEDEAVALAFEAAHPEFARREPAAGGATGATAAGARSRDGFLRTWPHRHGCDAFFAASWTRTSRAS